MNHKDGRGWWQRLVVFLLLRPSQMMVVREEKNKSPGTAGAFIQYLAGAFICLPPVAQRLFCAVWKETIQEKGMKEGI